MPRTFVRHDGERVKSDLTTRVRVPTWIDPYAWIQGSSIEKMVMAEFARRGIYFEHTIQQNPLPWFPWMVTSKIKPANWEPDFLLPQYKIWIEIQGGYFHTLPGKMEDDALRMAYIDAVGWKPIAWWEDDIRTRLQELMDAVPQFYMINRGKEQAAQDKYPNTYGLPFYEGGGTIDHLKGLRTALRGRARPPQHIQSRYRTKRKPK
jgi:hypothetical protein